MSNTTIEGSIVIISEDVGGASVSVPHAHGRLSFTEIVIRTDGVHLVDREGTWHHLEGADPETHSQLADMTVVVREMDLDGESLDKEYPISVSVDESLLSNAPMSP